MIQFATDDRNDSRERPDCFIGTSAAIILAAGAIGSKIASAKIASNAAKKAADIQSQAADKAAAVTQAGRAQMDARMAPYSTGGQAYTTLGEALGIKAPTVNQPPMATDPNHIANGQPFPASWVPGNPANAGAPPPPGAPGTQPAPSQQPEPAGGIAPPPAVDASGYGPVASSQQQTRPVRISWADGSSDSVPAEHVGQYVTLGAKVVQ